MKLILYYPEQIFLYNFYASSLIKFFEKILEKNMSIEKLKEKFSKKSYLGLLKSIKNFIN